MGNIGLLVWQPTKTAFNAPIATDICDHEAVIARQKGMPVYNNYDELQSVAEQLTPEHGAWNDIFEFAIEDKFPTGEYQFKPEGMGLQ